MRRHSSNRRTVPSRILWYDVYWKDHYGNTEVLEAELDTKREAEKVVRDVKREGFDAWVVPITVAMRDQIAYQYSYGPNPNRRSARLNNSTKVRDLYKTRNNLATIKAEMEAVIDYLNELAKLCEERPETCIGDAKQVSSQLKVFSINIRSILRGDKLSLHYATQKLTDIIEYIEGNIVI